MDEPRRIRLLLSRVAAERFGARIAALLPPPACELLHAEDLDDAAEVDMALLTRDVTGTSTNRRPSEGMARFCGVIERSPVVRWIHTHSAGADRPILTRMMARGTVVTTSSGANAGTVAVTAVAGILALARRFPHFMDAQRRHAWEPIDDRASQDARKKWGSISRRNQAASVPKTTPLMRLRG